MFQNPVCKSQGNKNIRRTRTSLAVSQRTCTSCSSCWFASSAQGVHLVQFLYRCLSLTVNSCGFKSFFFFNFLSTSNRSDIKIYKVVACSQQRNFADKPQGQHVSRGGAICISICLRSSRQLRRIQELNEAGFSCRYTSA